MTEGDKTETPNDTEVKPAEKTVAKIGEKVYKTLAEAVEAAEDGETIVLTDNIGDEASETNKILKTMNIDKNITIQGEGHIIKRTKDFTGTIFNIEAGKSLNLENLTLDGSGTGLSMEYSVKTDNGYANDHVIVKYDSSAIVSEKHAIINKGKLFFNKVVAKNFITKANGGMIKNEAGDVEFNNSQIMDNYSTINGSVIYSNGGTFRMLGSKSINNGSGGFNTVDNKLHGGDSGFGYCTQTDIVIKDSYFEKNFAGFNGGAFHVTLPKNLVVENTDFIDLIVGNDSGAFQLTCVLANSKIDIVPENLLFKNCTFKGIKGLAQGNQSIGSVMWVGGEYLNQDLIFEGCSFDKCEGISGVICGNASENSKYIYIKNSKFTDNKGSCLYRGHFKVYDSIFTGNTHRGFGTVITIGLTAQGVIYYGKTEIYNSLIENNFGTGQATGAIYIHAGDLIVGKGTIIRNNTGKQGGGVVLRKNTNLFRIEEGAAIYDNKGTLNANDILIESKKSTLEIPVIEKIKFMDNGIEKTIDGYFFDLTKKRFDKNDYTQLTRKMFEDMEGKSVYLQATNIYDVYIPYEPEVTTVPNLDIPMEEKPISHEEIEEPELPEVPLSNKPVAPKVKANSIVPKTGVPKTGDGMEEVMWTLGIMISLLGLSFVMRRKENN